MALFDNPPHRVNSLTPSAFRDDGGGTDITYTLAQSGIPCLINTLSSSEQEMFAQEGLTVSHRVGFLSSVLSPDLTRGMKLIATDTLGGQFEVRGIQEGRAMGNVPSLLYAICQQIL